MKPSVTTCAVIAVMALELLAGCDPSGPQFGADFPFFYMQDIDTDAPSPACGFIGAYGDGLACSGQRLLFIDGENGYVKAYPDLGYPLDHCASTSEGGYGMAVSGQLLMYVSNDTYLEHDPVLLPANGLFIVPKPSSTTVWVICSGGVVATVSTASAWTVESVTDTPVEEPAAAAVTSDGSCLFIADAADGTVRKFNSATMDLQATEEVNGGATDLITSPSSGVYASPAGLSEIWHLDGGTGLHDFSVAIPGPAECIAATPDDAHLYAGGDGYGLVVVDRNGSLEAQTTSYGTPSDIVVREDGNRALVCAPDLLKVFVLSR